MNFGAFHLPTAIVTGLVVIGAVALVLYLKKHL